MGSPFSIDVFAGEVKTALLESNINQIKNSKYISAHDVSNSCIRSVVMKLLKYPVSVSDAMGRWLPLQMRAEIGNSVHEFILSSKQFTETEVSLRCQSLNLSCRLDGLIDNNIIVEIKTCSYDDYKDIIAKKTPRTADFHQTLIYKYLLENHLDELKQAEGTTRTNVPKLDKYEIDTIQFIYVAHEIIPSSDTLNRLKKELNSKVNQFYFVCSLCVDIDDSNRASLEKHMSYLLDKVREINKFLNNQEIPPLSHKYVDKSKCYFCVYRTTCEENK